MYALASLYLAALPLLISVANCLPNGPLPLKYSGLYNRDEIASKQPELEGRLSPQASISTDPSSAPRWSDYHAPKPIAIVNVATELDVATTVQWCNKHKVPFLAQNGGHGWINSFNLEKNGVIINLRGLNSTTFNSARTQATIGGGAIVSEVIEQAYTNDAQVLTGNCNCVGTLGAALGGGYGNLLGNNGFSVDNFQSISVVLADGTYTTVTEKQADLWWALRGAAPNFGIVTKAVMKSKLVPKASSTAWLGPLFFTEDKLEKLVQGIQDLNLEKSMNIYLYFATTGAPDFSPSVFVTVFYLGPENEGRAAFKPIFDLGPVKDGTTVLPYNQWNAGADGFCLKGGRKPSYGVGIGQMVPSTWRQIWTEYKELLKTPGFGYSAILTECYSLGVAQSIPASTASFANRDVRFNSIAIPSYADASLDPKAEAFGTKFRNLLRETDGYTKNRTYINFGFGDESNEVVYGSNVARLRKLKKEYDPKNIFNHWFPIQT